MKYELKKLLSILSIPLREQWIGFSEKESYTVYSYWKALKLLDNEEYDYLFKTNELSSSTSINNYFKSINYHFKPRFYYGGKVADVGSGFGFITFWLVLNGADKVYTIGDPERIGFIKKLYERAIELDLIGSDRIVFKPSFVKVGDSVLSEDIEIESLDLVLLNDTLEHITQRIFPYLASSSYNGLKKGGLFISRQQNTDSPKMLNRLKSVWEDGEKSHYLNQRLTMIMDEIPEIDSDSANQLAIKTRGLDKLDFVKALNIYRTDKVFPNHNLDIAPIDLVNDVPHEGDTGISRITNQFKKLGFNKIMVYPDLLSSRRSKYFQPVARLLPKIFLGLRLFDQTSIFYFKK